MEYEWSVADGYAIIENKKSDKAVIKPLKAGNLDILLAVSAKGNPADRKEVKVRFETRVMGYLDSDASSISSGSADVGIPDIIEAGGSWRTTDEGYLLVNVNARTGEISIRDDADRSTDKTVEVWLAYSDGKEVPGTRFKVDVPRVITVESVSIVMEDGSSVPSEGISVREFETVSLKAKVFPEMAEDSEVTWSVEYESEDDEDRITTSGGLDITGLTAGGRCVITAKSGKNSSVSSLPVEAVVVEYSAPSKSAFISFKAWDGAEYSDFGSVMKIRKGLGFIAPETVPEDISLGGKTYVFIGWSENPAGKTSPSPAEPVVTSDDSQLFSGKVSDDAVLYACYAPSVHLTFMYWNPKSAAESKWEAFDESDVRFASAFSSPDSRPGLVSFDDGTVSGNYVFSGWTDADMSASNPSTSVLPSSGAYSSGSIESDVVLYACYERFSYMSNMVTVEYGNTRFQVSKYEITQEVWDYVYEWIQQDDGRKQRYSHIPANPSLFKRNPAITNGRLEDARKRPVERVIWTEACSFCNALSEMEGLQPDHYDGTNSANANLVCFDAATIWLKSIKSRCSKTEDAGYRIPSVNEWKIAACGGNYKPDGSSLFKYSGSDDIDEVGWNRGDDYSNGGNAQEMTHQVGLLAPNGYGLYDMTGNVIEWCMETDEVHVDTDNLNARSYKFFKYALGGGWDTSSTRSELSNCTHSFTSGAAWWSPNIGFRVFRSLP